MDSVRHLVGRNVRQGRRLARRGRLAAVAWRNDHRSPAVRAACYAAHSALYLRPDGVVQACCATGWEVGTVTGPDRRSLLDIWNGAELREHRQRLEADRFDLGCQECEVAIGNGGRESSLAHHFDRWKFDVPTPYPHLIDFALSSRCNLQCVMCNGELSSAIRTQREGRAPMPAAYDDRFFDELNHFLPHLRRAQFKGGEPFLAPENKRVWDELIRIGYRGETTITTNGTLWNDEVEHYFRALRAEPNISVDGMTAEVLEPIRVGVDAAKLWANIDRAQSIAEEVGSTLTLSYCLMTTNWHELPDFLTEVDRRGVSCYIILVNQPHRYDVLRLTHRELVDIVESLDRRRPVFTHARPESEWERIMRRLRSQIEHPVELNVVVVPPPDRARSEPEPAPPAPPPVPVDEPALRRATRKSATRVARKAAR